MSHERAVQGYITGLLVFLGLIGTFIGLMEMVHSVGGIIGGLAQSDSASADSVKRLIHDLEAPLVGMAQGFSSSLFGLFTSLVLGIVMRFGMAASYSVKEEFESWLANVSQLENESTGEDGGSGQASGGSNHPASAAALLGAIRRSNQAFDRTTETLRQLVDRQGDQTDAIRRICAQLENVARQQAESNAGLSKLDALQAELGLARGDVYRVGGALEARLEESAAKWERELGVVARAGEQWASTLATRAEMADFVRSLDKKLAESTQAVQREIDAARRDQMTATRALTSEAVELRSAVGAVESRLTDASARVEEMVRSGQRDVVEATKQLSKGQEHIDAHLKELAEAPVRELRAIARSVETRIGTEMADVARVLEGISRMLADSLGQLAVQQAHMAQAVMQLPQAGQTTREMEQLRKALEDGLSGGLAAIAEAIEGAFQSDGGIAARDPSMSDDPKTAPERHHESPGADRLELQNLAAERWSSRLKRA